MTQREVAISAAVDLSIALDIKSNRWFLKTFVGCLAVAVVLFLVFGAPYWFALSLFIVLFAIQAARHETICYLIRMERAQIFREHLDIHEQVEEDYNRLTAKGKSWRSLP